MVDLISAVRRDWAAACMSAVDESGAHLMSVAHPISVAGEWAAGKPGRGSQQGRDPTLSVRLRRMARGLPAVERGQTQVETGRSDEIGSQQPSGAGGTLRV